MKKPFLITVFGLSSLLAAIALQVRADATWYEEGHRDGVASTYNPIHYEKCHLGDPPSPVFREARVALDPEYIRGFRQGQADGSAAAEEADCQR